MSIEKKNPVLVNSFAMEVDGLLWQPGQVGKEECNRTFKGAWSSLGEKPFFNISAYRDAKGRTDADSENVLEIQVMNVRETGEYKLTGSYLESFKSYALFKITKQDGSSGMYSNKHDISSFTVSFEQFISRPGTNLKGVKGAFYGTLYNEKDPLDSIVIKRGAFVFKKTNEYNFRQCE
ncbi:DUF5025 domain-containing protein [Pedobacter sp. ASV1-7]|uniref:DUF5025 domain-containing protein n=1 Tax=Pedobacter sp. ASV1-7 TaxID=3145237 RepID=UPI0032E8DFC2